MDTLLKTVQTINMYLSDYVLIILLLGAENEPGWRAVVDGREFPLATAWGHQVAVPLPWVPTTSASLIPKGMTVMEPGTVSSTVVG